VLEPPTVPAEINWRQWELICGREVWAWPLDSAQDKEIRNHTGQVRKNETRYTGTRMQKAFHWDSASEPYVADAVVLTCFDQRVRTVVNKFLQKRGILRPDMVVIAGGAKTLASPRNDFERDFILEQVRMSILLHRTTRACIMCHSDCATYGGLAAFNGDR
jgi:carbonic anhydrase